MDKKKCKTTKQLAMELGIVRKRTSVSLPNKAHNFKRTGQMFYYLVVLDFESTCWEDRRNIPQEIIEFPAVLLNTSTGQIEREFHHYVQPHEKPILSAFCRQLTGITQEQVEDGIPLNLCLSRFSHWLQRLARDKNISYNATGDPDTYRCTFVTWSDWDLGVCLEFETRRKQLRRLAPLCSWIDLRATYKKFYSRKPSGLNGALLDLGIAFEGRQHSGLDDARNTANLAWRMICDGCLMTITKTLTPSWGGQSCISRSLRQPNMVTAPIHDNTTCQQTRQGDTFNDKKPDNGRTANKPDVSVVRPGNEQAAAKPQFSEFRNHDSNTYNSGGLTFTSVKPSYVRTSKNNETRRCPAFSPRACLTCPPSGAPTNVMAPSSTTNHQGRKHTGFQISSPPVGIAHTALAPKDITNLPTDVAITSTNETSNSSSFQGLVLSKTADTPVYQSCYVVSTPSPNDTENDILLKTPPLCLCGRRCKRNCVQSPGANVGRSFFCCPLGRSSSGSKKSQTGCGFFQWEQTGTKRCYISSPASISGNSTSKSVHFSPPSNMLPQPNFDTPGSEVKISRCGQGGRYLR